MKRIQFKNLSIQTKFFIPIGVILGCVVVGSTWYFVVSQRLQSEQAFREHLTSLAVTSPLMIHAAAEEYAQKVGLRYHRVSVDDAGGDSDLGRLERKAAVTFASDPALLSLEEGGVENGEPWMYVFAPGRIQDECLACHQASGLDVFGSKKVGEVAAVFSISGPTTALLDQQARSRLLTLLVGGGMIIAISFILRYFMKRLVIRPLHTLVDTTGAVAEGDLTIKAPVTTNDEVGRLGIAVNDMVHQLRETIGEVHEVASSVASASAEISSSTEEMAAGAREQTSQTGEVASAVEQMTKTILENSKNASTTAETAKKARGAAKQGGVAVRETVIGMQRIANVVNKSAETVQALGKSTNQIGEIIGVIDDIADQTNLLALNAAIEAARAGEQGRGFAVVADEVRKLAERTTKATKEIADMIKTIQIDTQSAVGSMEEGTKEVANGIKLVDMAGTSLNEIVEISQNLTDMVAQIAAASEEQSSASEQISKNVEAISAVTSETAQGTQQIARAAEDLNRLTETLQQLVSRFRLSSESGQLRESVVLKGGGGASGARHDGTIVPRSDEKGELTAIAA